MALFTSDHIEKQRALHKEFPAYGQASMVFAPMVSELINANGVTELLDYGSGLGEVSKRLEVQQDIVVTNYDPAISQYESSPKPAEMVICLDVLDTVEETCVDDVLDDLKNLTKKMAFFSVSTKPAGEGDQSDNPHHYQPVEWWLPKIMERFELHYFSRIDNGFVVVLRAFSEH